MKVKNTSCFIDIQTVVRITLRYLSLSWNWRRVDCYMFTDLLEELGASSSRSL